MLKLNEKTNIGQDKIARFNWVVADKPGFYMEIDKTLLDVDDSYQRRVKENSSKVLDIANRWSWIACGCIIVGWRDAFPSPIDAQARLRAAINRGAVDIFFVIDGQHRVRGALKRSDINNLPCMVFECEETKTEAIGFFTINVVRTGMHSTEVFKAKLTGEDPLALRTQEIVKRAGRHVARHAGPDTFSAVSTVNKCLEKDEQTLLRIWPLLMEICEGQVMSHKLISGFWTLERRLAPAGISVTDAKWSKRAVKIGAGGFSKAMTNAAIYYGKGGEKVCCDGIAQALNKGMRSKLSL
jgi:hypothetical protein